MNKASAPRMRTVPRCCRRTRATFTTEASNLKGVFNTETPVRANGVERSQLEPFF